jgi:hypothetical protein
MILFNNTPLFTLGGSSPFWVIESLTSVDGAIGMRSNGSRQNGEVLIGGSIGSTGSFFSVFDSKGSLIETRRSPLNAGLPDAAFTEDTVSGNLYMFDSPTGTLVKYDSNFSFIWARDITDPPGISVPPHAAISDNGDAHLIFVNSTAGLTVAKINADGTPSFKRQADRADFRSQSGGLGVYGPSGTIYACTVNIDDTASDFLQGTLISYDSSGSLRFQRKVDLLGLDDLLFAHQLLVASENEIYTVWTYLPTNLGVDPRGILVVKTDADANVVWRKLITHGSTQTPGDTRAALDPLTGDLYIVSQGSAAQNTSTVYALSPAGSLEWASTISGAPGFNARVGRGLSATSEALYASGLGAPLIKISKTGIPLSGGQWTVAPQATTVIDLAITLSVQNLTITTGTVAAATVTDPFTDTPTLTETLVRL